jgi:hypothetical protein
VNEINWQAPGRKVADEIIGVAFRTGNAEALAAQLHKDRPFRNEVPALQADLRALAALPQPPLPASTLPAPHQAALDKTIAALSPFTLDSSGLQRAVTLKLGDVPGFNWSQSANGIVRGLYAHALENKKLPELFQGLATDVRAVKDELAAIAASVA